MVMIYHFAFKAVAEPGGLLDKMTPYEFWLPGTWPFVWWGWVGVQIFFTISGLVIAFSAASQTATPAGLLRSRVLRLWPAVLIASCLAVVIEVLVFHMSLTNALIIWLRTALFHPLPPWLMGQFWTIGIEVFFYILVLFSLVLGQVHRLRQLAAALILISAVYWTARLLNDGHDPLGRITQIILFQHGAYFGIGILLAARKKPSLRLSDAVLIIIGFAVAAVQIRMVSGWEAGHANLQQHWPVPFSIYVACVCCVRLSMIHNERLISWLGFNGAFVARRIGVMKYPLYLMHNHVGKPVILATIEIGAAPWIAILAAMTAAFVTAWLVAEKLEPIVYRALAHIYDRVARVFRSRESA